MTKEQVVKLLEGIIDMRQRKIKMRYEGTAWTQDDKDRLAMMYGVGYGITGIALILERTEAEVVEQLKEQGLYRYPRNSD